MADKNEAEVKPAADVAAGAAAPVGDAAAAGQGAPVRAVKLKGGKSVPMGVAFIKATFNNTIVSITDMKGGVIAWSSAGRVGMSGSRKSTAFAATLVGQEVGKQAVARGMHEVEIRVQGAGAGRESAIRAIQAAGINISYIKDVTPIPHNGCRPRKRRRV